VKNCQNGTISPKVVRKTCPFDVVRMGSMPLNDKRGKSLYLPHIGKKNKERRREVVIIGVLAGGKMRVGDNYNETVA
jgi:hypothetical protein